MRNRIWSSNPATPSSCRSEVRRNRIAGVRAGVLALAASSALLLAAPALWAQQDSAPASAQGAEQSSAAPDAGAQSAPGPVGGVEEYRFPGASLGRSFFVPRLTLQQVYNSNSGYATSTAASQADAVTVLSGGFSLQVLGRRSAFSIDESSEGLIYNRQTQPNGVVEQFGATEKITLQRWNLLFGEQVSYLPNSAFGLGGLGYLGGGTSGLSGIGGVTGFNPFQIPTQTIVSPNVSQLSETSLFQAQYLINGTSSVNGSVIVGFLHFFGSDLLNSRSITARFGYDKSITARDTLTISYQATNLDYPSGISGFTTHYAQVGYRRILTGRLQAAISAGPSVTHFSQSTAPGGTNLVSWSLLSSLNYLLRNGSLGAQYSHGSAGGSGYLVGSIADQFTGSFSHRLSRVWTVNFSGGYSHNGAFQQTTQAGGNPSASFNYWFAGGSVSRPIGHFSSLSFSYNASRQTSNSTVCVNGVTCGPVALVQVAGVTFNWSTRPYAIE
ncbi:MAG TPA: hypothetical protein VLW54_14795 [Candidatus Acidoferrales bacterium]|nr:hypothetical protein [Candidatus Acidoferrales bacterium]